jgi:hypothetical protein
VSPADAITATRCFVTLREQCMREASVRTRGFAAFVAGVDSLIRG